MPNLVLASGSAIRNKMLTDAGLTFRQVRPDVDEAAIKDRELALGAPIADIALTLAEAKALAGDPGDGSLAIGSDQILGFQGQAFDKPVSLDEARTRLKEFQGDTHQLLNGTAVARHGEIIYARKNTVSLHMRTLTDHEIDAYIEAAGPDILSSVGGYMVERHGSRLFSAIDGDYFSVLGMHLFPLLAFLREEKVIDF